MPDPKLDIRALEELNNSTQSNDIRQKEFGDEDLKKKNLPKLSQEDFEYLANTQTELEPHKAISRPFLTSKYDEPLQPGESIKDNSWIEKHRANNQPWHHEATNAIAGGITKGVFGAIENMGYLLDFTTQLGYNNILDKAESNAVSDAFRQARLKVDEVLPIYKDNPDTFLDGWRATSDILQNVTEFAIPGGIIAKGIGKGVSLLGKLGRYGNLLANSETATEILSTVPTAYLTNRMESARMAVEDFEQNMQMLSPYIKAGQISSEKAAQIAQDEANKIYMRNLPMMWTDILALKGIIKGSKLTRGAYNKTQKQLNRSLFNKVTEFTGQNALEGLEETYQGIAEREATYNTLKRAGIDPKGIYNGNLGERISNYLGDKSLQYEALLGFMAGGMQRLGAQVVSGGFYSNKDRDRDQQLQNDREELLTSTSSNLQGMLQSFIKKETSKQEAINKGYSHEAELWDDIDYINNITAHLSYGTVDKLESVLDVVEQDGIKSFGEESSLTQEDEPQIKTAARELKDKLRFAEKKWLKYSNLPFKSRVSTVNNEMIYTSLEKVGKGLDSKISEIKDDIRKVIESSNFKEHLGNIKLDEPRKAFLGNKDLNAQYTNFIEQTSNDKITELEQLQQDKAGIENYKRNLRTSISESTTPKAIAKAKREEMNDIEKQKEKIVEETNNLKKEKTRENRSKQEYDNLSSRAPNADNISKLDNIDKEIKSNKFLNSRDKEELFKNIKAQRDHLEKIKTQPKVVSTEEEVTKPSEFTEGFTTLEDMGIEPPTGTNKVKDIQIGNHIAKLNYDNTYSFFRKSKEGKLSLLNNPTVSTIKEAKIVLSELNKELDIKESNNQEELSELLSKQDRNSDPDTYTSESNKSVNSNNTQSELNEGSLKQPGSIFDTNKDDKNSGYSSITQAYNTIAWLGRKYRQETRDNNTVIIDLEDELNESSFKLLMDPDKFLPGSKITLEVEDDDSVPMYDLNLRDFESITTWGEYKKSLMENRVFEDLTNEEKDLYISNIPVRIIDEYNNKLGYIHRTEWSDIDRISGDVELDRKNNLELRKSVYEKSSLNTEITYKSYGSLMSAVDNKKDSLKNRFKDPNLVISVWNHETQSLQLSRDKKYKGHKDDILVNTTLVSGIPYVIAKIQKNTYMGIPVTSSKIKDYNKDLSNSLLKVVDIWTKSNSKQPLIPIEQSLVDQIMDMTNNDVRTFRGFRDFIKIFLKDYNTKGKDLKSFDRNDLKVSDADGIIHFTGNSIEFFTGGLDKVLEIGTNTPINSINNLKLILKNVVDNAYINVNLDYMENNNFYVPFIQENKVIDLNNGKSYKDFLKEVLNTNLLSFNIGTEETPNFIYTTQQVITFDSKLNPISTREENNTITTPQSLITKNVNIENKTKEGFNEFFGKYTASLDDFIDEMPLVTKEEDIEIDDPYIMKGFNFYEQSLIINSSLGTILDFVKAADEQNAGLKVNKTLESYKKSIESVRDDYQEIGNKKMTDFYNKWLNNYDKFSNILKLKFQRLRDVHNKGLIGDIEEILNEDFEDTTTLEKSFNDDFYLTLNKANKTTARFRYFLTGIKRLDKNGNPQLYAPGLYKTVNFDEVFSTLQRLLSNIRSNYNTMYNELLQYKNSIDWMPDFLKKLDKSSERTKKEFAVTMGSSYINMKFSMWSQQGKENYFQTWDANANSTSKFLQQQWKDNIVDTNLIILDPKSTEYKLNESISNKLLEDFNKFKESLVTIDNKDIINWLSNLGINVSDGVIKHIRTNNIRIQTSESNKVGVKLSWDQQFETSGIFGNLNEKLKTLLKQQKDGEEINFTDLFNGRPINTFARIIASIEDIISPNSFVIANKTYYPFSLTKFLTDRTRDILEDKMVINALLNNSYSKDSLLLNRMVSRDKGGNIEFLDSSIRKVFDIQYTSPEALRKISDKEGRKDEINEFTPQELEAFQANLFFDTRSKLNNGKDRKVIITLPPLSDKHNLMLLETIAYRPSYIESKAQLSNSDLQVLYSQLVLPDLRRMLVEKENLPDIDKYKEGQNLFYLFPELNKFDEFFDNNGKIVDDILDPNKDYISKIKSILNDFYIKEANTIVNKWKEFGLITKDSRYLNEQYFKENLDNKEFDEQNFLAALDYSINHAIMKSNIYQLYVGDIAQYYKSSKSKSKLDQVKDTIDNVGKRLAGLNATGIDLTNNDENTFDILIAKDISTTSFNIEQLSNTLYNKSFTRQQLLQMNKKTLESEYPYLYPYVYINSTDAQELTTWRDHLYIMNQRGLLDEEVYKEIYDKLEQGKELTSEQLGTVMQPMKPVYFGDVYGENPQFLRKLYVKSSSYPLLSQLTKGTNLDNLRIKLEDYEKETKRNIRVAYESAVKVGSIKNKATLFNEDGIFNEKLDINNHVIKNVPRRHFKIQQDIPYNEAKKEISMGTQGSKLLFDTVRFIKDKVFNGKTGTELYSNYLQLHKELLKIGQKELEDKLNYNSSTGTINIKKLQELLLNEAIERGFSINEIKGLGLKNNKFVIPPYLSGNWKKYQALLTSLVTNKIIKQQFPGIAVVLGSETGYKIKEGTEETINSYNIVYTNKDIKFLKPIRLVKKDIYEKSKVEEEPSKQDLNNGNYITLGSQVILPWRFKDNEGNLINIQDYLNEDNTLNLDKIDPKLLEWIGFRIPTQKHSSMTKIEVVGFLPNLSGDLIIASQDLVAQMGSDFDVDKLYMYRYNYMVEDGILKVGVNDENAKKINQNKIIDIYHQVLSNKEIVKKMMKPLDYGKLKELSDKYKSFIKEDSYNPLSPLWNMDKFFQANSGGKLGVASFALTSVLNAQAQGLNLQFLKDDGSPFEINFGDFKSNGTISGEHVIGDNTRSISDVISAYLSSSVDNEKERILEKLNINNHTFPIIKVLTLMGFDEDVVIPFINQPIIKQYINEVFKLNSKFSQVKGKIGKIAFDNIINSDTYKTNTSIKDLEAISDIGPIEMVKFLTMENPPKDIQIGLLRKFKKIEVLGETLQRLETTFNTDSKGVGKNFIEVQTKLDNLQSLEGEFSNISNIGNLLNNSISGFAITEGLYNVNKYFGALNPFNSRSFNKVEEDFKKATNNVTSPKIKQLLWNGMKAYLYNTTGTDLYINNIEQERKRIYFDTYKKDIKGHYSLASIVKDIQDKKIIKNYLLSSFQPQIEKNGNPSLLKFNAAQGELFDDSIYFQAFYDLLRNKSLGIYNGKEYTTLDLANDLVRYTMLNGNLQESKDFARYIPVDYLKLNNQFLNYLNTINLEDDSKFGIIEGGKDWDISNFTIQFIQHNPWYINYEVTSTKELSSMDNKSLTSVKKFKIENIKDLPVFVKIATTNNTKGFNIYKFNGEFYEKLNVLGSNFFTEYNMDNDNIQSSIYRNFDPFIPNKTLVPNSPINPINPKVLDKNIVTEFGIKEGKNIEQIMINIRDHTSSDFYKHLIDHLLRNKQMIQDTMVLIDSKVIEAASYNSRDNLLTINPTAPVRNFEDTLIHELLHAYTSRLIRNPQTPEQQLIVMRLQNVQELLKSKIKEGFKGLNQQELESFEKKLKQYKIDGKVTFTSTDLSKYYATISLPELISMTIADPITRDLMKDIEIEPNTSLLQKIKEILIDLLNTLISKPEFLTNTAFSEVLSNTLLLTSKESNLIEIEEGINEENNFVDYQDDIIFTEEELNEYDSMNKCKKL